MCFFGSSKSQPAPMVQTMATQAQEAGAFDQAKADEQRRRMAASNAGTQGMVDSAMTTQTASAAGRTVLGG